MHEYQSLLDYLSMNPGLPLLFTVEDGRQTQEVTRICPIMLLVRAARTFLQVCLLEDVSGMAH